MIHVQVSTLGAGTMEYECSDQDIASGLRVRVAANLQRPSKYIKLVDCKSEVLRSDALLSALAADGKLSLQAIVGFDAGTAKVIECIAGTGGTSTFEECAEELMTKLAASAVEQGQVMHIGWTNSSYSSCTVHDSRFAYAFFSRNLESRGPLRIRFEVGASRDWAAEAVPGKEVISITNAGDGLAVFYYDGETTPVAAIEQIEVPDPRRHSWSDLSRRFDELGVEAGQVIGVAAGTAFVCRALPGRGIASFEYGFNSHEGCDWSGAAQLVCNSASCREIVGILPEVRHGSWAPGQCLHTLSSK